MKLTRESLIMMEELNGARAIDADDRHNAGLGGVHFDEPHSSSIHIPQPPPESSLSPAVPSKSKSKSHSHSHHSLPQPSSVVDTYTSNGNGKDGTSSTSSSVNDSANANHHHPHHPQLQTNVFTFKDEARASLLLMSNAKLNILIICGPAAIISSIAGFNETIIFCFAGLALIPCAERLSFVTEQVAEHTNETIGALLNATFGNAPEFLISSAALRSGFYRVVQLTLLGSMLTNLLFVFGLSCFIGGLQWQVQEIRITSGNVSIGMLLTAAMGLVLPAALKLSNESNMVNVNLSRRGLSDIAAIDMNTNERVVDSSGGYGGDNTSYIYDDDLTENDILFSRINAIVMVIGYISYLIFQLGSHKEEFDYDGDEYAAFGGGHNIVRTSHYNQQGQDKEGGEVRSATLPKKKRKPVARRNVFCIKNCVLLKYCPNVHGRESGNGSTIAKGTDVEGEASSERDVFIDHYSHHSNIDLKLDEVGIIELTQAGKANGISKRRKDSNSSSSNGMNGTSATSRTRSRSFSNNKANGSDEEMNRDDMHGIKDKLSDDYRAADARHHHYHPTLPPSLDPMLEPIQVEQDLQEQEEYYQQQQPMTMRMGLVWLGVITAVISILSNLLVETIDGFAIGSNMSEVFTSVIIIPFFSNIAEQVSAVIFAYRNKMDLCIGVTVGSAIQIGQFVMPGCVLVGWMMDKSMTLYFRGYETICLLLGVLCVAAVLQGGTTNWLVGVFFVGVYTMIAAGFAFHEKEDLSTEDSS
eukprot:CAMPEP_0194119342 /NCGR_PEP_ID=MMETSP0150-20130528/38975_1 /TAXON_ID=122233 /ORGANISM="Chaetoceros debilis, Strain MM31A-1" /LENGTH=753 /DNA_ID=CAMNT_0038811011 /DNA_START=59 /DNA_END=2320 /DNA_ORIENTATION=+